MPEETKDTSINETSGARKKSAYSIFRVGSFIAYTLCGLVGVGCVVFFGILPISARMWAWNPFGIGLVVGIVVATLLAVLGSWLRGKAEAKENQEDTGDDK